MPMGLRRLVNMLNGESARCSDEAVMELEVNGMHLRVRCKVAMQLVCDAKVIMHV